jgi:hypothetical protein
MTTQTKVASPMIQTREQCWQQRAEKAHQDAKSTARLLLAFELVCGAVVFAVTTGVLVALHAPAWFAAGVSLIVLALMDRGKGD